MADTVELDAGAGGAIVATDDAGAGGHVQIVKLALSADGSATPITADADGLLVKLTAQGGVDLGDVTVNNGAGASSVPVQGGAAHDAAAAGNPLLMGGYAKAAAPTDVSADADAVRAWYLLNGAAAVNVTAAGALIAGDATNGLDVDVTRSALPSGASTSAKQDTVIGHLDGVEGLLTTIDGDTGNISTKIDTVAGAVSGTEMQVDVLTIAAGDNNIGNVDVASIAAGDNNIGNVDIASALPAGTNAIGKLAANSGVDIGDVDVTSISAGTNAIGNVGLIGRTTGGLSIFSSIDLDESEEEVKATAGQVFSISAFNRTAVPLYLKFYNLTAANTTVGSSAISATFVVPANADSDGAGFVWNNSIGLAFSTAISVAATTGVAASDTGAPGANDCVVVIGYM